VCATAQAAEQVRVWHTLDAAMSERLARHAAEYNALQQEFRVRLEPLRAADGKGLVRLPLPPQYGAAGSLLQPRRLSPRASFPPELAEAAAR